MIKYVSRNSTIAEHRMPFERTKQQVSGPRSSCGTVQANQQVKATAWILDQDRRNGAGHRARGVDGGHREAVLCRMPGPGHRPGFPLVQAAVVAAQDQRGRCGSRRPQDAGDLAEGEFAFEDAIAEALFGSESHGCAFGSARERRSRTTYRPTVTLEGSTHVDTAFTGTTSSFSRTASGKLAVVAVFRQRVFAGL
jgi:hypothetical protein